MGKIFTLTPDIKKIAQDAIDDLIDQLGKDCLLVYSSVKADCPNCLYDPITKRSTGRYKLGGPRPFPNGQICPVCRGTGQLESESTEIIRMLCQWNPARFTSLSDATIQIPNSIVQTKGYIWDLPKILRARTIILQLPIEPYIRYRFQLWGEPIDSSNIIQSRYFVATWKRMG